MSSRVVVESIEGEYLRYKKLGDDAIAQVRDADLIAADPRGINSIATIVWHISGNFRSRFTEFLTTDGEKPWRRRDEEFEGRVVSRDEVLLKWTEGWGVLLGALDALDDGHLERTVTIRQQPLLVRDALLRSLAHASYHVGQIVLLARLSAGADWKYLSIPPGQSEAYNRMPALEKPPARSR
jgi:hypothetical protein